VGCKRGRRPGRVGRPRWIGRWAKRHWARCNGRGRWATPWAMHRGRSAIHVASRPLPSRATRRHGRRGAAPQARRGCESGGLTPDFKTREGGGGWVIWGRSPPTSSKKARLAPLGMAATKMSISLFPDLVYKSRRQGSPDRVGGRARRIIRRAAGLSDSREEREHPVSIGGRHAFAAPRVRMQHPERGGRRKHDAARRHAFAAGEPGAQRQSCGRPRKHGTQQIKLVALVVGTQPANRRITRAAFCPPKPKLVEMPVRTGKSRAMLGT
jgi:hypothetical protein